MWVHTAKSRNNTGILQISSCQINGGISGAHPSLWKRSAGSSLRARFACQNTLDDSDIEWLFSRARAWKIALWIWRKASEKMRTWPFGAKSGLDWVKNSVGMQSLANQRCLNCGKQVLLGWTGWNNIFSPLSSRTLPLRCLHLFQLARPVFLGADLNSRMSASDVINLHTCCWNAG